MSGLGLSHVFPFQQESEVEPQQDPQRAQSGSSQGSDTSRLGIEGLAHVFPWLTPPMGQSGLQVFEPLDIGDSEESSSEESNDAQSETEEPETLDASPDLDAPVQESVEPHVEPETSPSQHTREVSVDELESVFAALEHSPEPLPSIEDIMSTPLIGEEKRLETEHQPIEEPESPVDVRAPTFERPTFERSPAPSPERPRPYLRPMTPPQQDEDESTDESPEQNLGEPETPKRALVPISCVANRYLLYDTDDISYLRRHHNICGVLIGTLPSHPQQNIFLGTPLELMPEEARLLVEQGVAYIVDDVEAHKTNFIGAGLSEAERKAFLRAMEKQGVDAMRANQKKSDTLKEQALKKNAEKIAKAREAKQKARQSSEAATRDSLFEEDSSSTTVRPASPAPSSHAGSASATDGRFHITPSTSRPPLPSPPTTPPATSPALPGVPKSYPLFAYLHSRGYFMTPGLRFGCQYCVYPGDPLRFHSHFLGVGMGWDDEFDLMTLIGGGRLGTGVKKGFLIGGRDERDGGEEGEVRAFSVEWSGM